LQQQIYICEWNNTVGVALEYASAAASCWFDMINALINCASGLCNNSLVNGTPVNWNNSGDGNGGSNTSTNTTTPTTNTSTTTDLTHYTFTFNGKKYSHYKSRASAESKIDSLVT